MKKKMKLIYIGVALISLLSLVVAGYLAKDFIKELNLDKVTQEQPEDTENNVILYKEPKNPTEFQKEIYANLLEATKKFPEEYDSFTVADYVVQSFVADFYTWTNKDGNFDVGGLDYVYGPNHLAFAMYARDTFYQNFNFFEKEYGVENLIEVDSITTRVDWAVPLVFNDAEQPTYYVRANWTYKESSMIDVSKFPTRAYFIVFLNPTSGRFEIASTYE